MKKYCILGSDKRNNSLREMYRQEGKEIASYEFADVVIAPVPFSKDDIKVNGEIIECDELIKILSNSSKVLYSGAISTGMKERLTSHGVRFFDLLDFESVATLNAIPTAEGAIQTAMEMTDFTLHGSNILILGFGKIGKVLAKMLSGIGSKVFCEARKEKDIALIDAMGYNSVNIEDLDVVLPSMNVIFNTIPNMMLDEERLNLINPSCSIVDLASSPGGVDFKKAKELGIDVIWALALPTKVAPYTAAIYLKNTIDKIESGNL